MANSMMRGVEQSSPKCSPRGSRSPAFMPSRENTTGTLRTTITLGKIPSVSRPFYLMKDLPDHDNLTGSTNLIKHYGLENSYTKFSGKKVKEEISAFLPNLPGNIDNPSSADNSSLRSLIEKPPICGKEIVTFTSTQLSGFRLHPGPLPEKYRQLVHSAPAKKRKKKEKYKEREEGGGGGSEVSGVVPAGGGAYSSGKGVTGAGPVGAGVSPAVAAPAMPTGAAGRGPGSVAAAAASVGPAPHHTVTSPLQQQHHTTITTPVAAPIVPQSAAAITATHGTASNTAASATAATASAQPSLTTILDPNLAHDRKHKRIRPKDEFEDKKKRKKKEKKKKKEKHHSPEHHSESSRDKFG